jgi:2'-5' RNA ligase
MQKYVIVYFIDSVTDGTRFSAASWPLHITLVSNFVTDREGSNLDWKLKQISSIQQPIIVQAQKNEYFGKNKDIKVTVMHPNLDLQKLHEKLFRLLSNDGALFDEPQFLLDGYRAHATVQENSGVQPGQSITITNLALVDMFPDNDITKRRVLKTVTFNDPLTS